MTGTEYQNRHHPVWIALYAAHVVSGTERSASHSDDSLHRQSVALADRAFAAYERAMRADPYDGSNPRRE